jgi:hypothetical protein
MRQTAKGGMPVRAEEKMKGPNPLGPFIHACSEIEALSILLMNMVYGIIATAAKPKPKPF